MATAVTPTPTTTGTALPPPVRTGAILAVSALPLWIVCFILLYGSMGPKNDTGLDAIHDAYLAVAAQMTVFGVVSLLAYLALGVAPAVIGLALARKTGRRWIGPALIVASIIPILTWLWNMASYFGFLAFGPTQLPGWVAITADGTTGIPVLNTVAWALNALSVVVLGFALWRARVTPRTGLVIGIIGTVLLVAVIALDFVQPMTTAALLFALGIALLRSRG